MLKKNKKVVSLFTQMITLFAFCCTFFLNSQNVLAAAEPYYVNYAEPSSGDNNGYLIIEYSSGKVATFFWSAYCESEYTNEITSVDTGCSLVIDDQRVIFTILTDKNLDPDLTNVTTYYTFSHYNSNGTYSLISSGSSVDSNPTYTYSTSATIVGFSYKGNISLVTNQLDSANSNPVIIFGDDIVGQYVNDLYLLIGQNKVLLETYLPKLNRIELWESKNNEQLETLVSITNDILSSIQASDSSNVQYLEYLAPISGYLASIDVDTNLMNETMANLLTVVSSISVNLEKMYVCVENIDELVSEYLHYLTLINGNLSSVEYDVESIDNNIATIKFHIVEYLKFLPEINGHVSTIEFDVETIDNNIATMKYHIVEYLKFLREINGHVSTIEFDVETIDNNVASMKKQLEDLTSLITESSSIDKEASDNFREESLDQTNMLDGLNQQAQLDKPNVDDMSDAVDDNLNVDIDANYGVLLSTFTSNNRILTMLLIVASVSLVSYVLFGKR